MQESIVFLVRVQCRRKESSRSLSHLLMSFLFNVYIYCFLANFGIVPIAHFESTSAFVYSLHNFHETTTTTKDSLLISVAFVKRFLAENMSGSRDT